MNSVEYGPLEETGMMSAGLDYYKVTMSQVHYEEHPDLEVTFTFKNRGEQRIEDYVELSKLQERFDAIREYGWQESELSFFASLSNSKNERVFTDDYIDYLRSNPLPEVEVTHDEDIDDLAIEATGPAALVTFWETIIMSELNEMYFEGVVRTEGLNLEAIYDEAEKRLSDKIAVLQENPDIKIIDFGTRRHFSLRWQKHVVERLKNECPNNLVGTSNVALANTMGLDIKGTFAHEMPMIWAAIADAKNEDIRASHGQFIDTWQNRYGKDLSVLLSDTFGSDFFFDDLTQEQAEFSIGPRHDSGDPYKFGEKVLAFYQKRGIDATEKMITFSDGLSISPILALHKAFEGRIRTGFGWGTDLTNDLGLKALNVVAKATHIRLPNGQEADTVKLSDVAGKHTGPAQKVEEYQHEFGKREVALTA